MGGAGPLDQLDRLVDGGVVGGAVGEEQLVEAEAQRRQHRRVEQPGRAAGEPLDRGVGGAAALDGAVGEPLGLGALAAGEAEALGLGAEGALGEGVVLEGRADRREGERAGRETRSARRSQSRQRVAAQVGVDRHRLAARRLHELEPQRALGTAEQQRALTPTRAARARR